MFRGALSSRIKRFFDAFVSAMGETTAVCNSFDFVSLSVSGLVIEGDVVSFPQHWKLIHNAHAPNPMSPDVKRFLKTIYDGCYRYDSGKLLGVDWS